MNRSLLGARNLNQVLQTALNPGDGGPGNSSGSAGRFASGIG